MDFDSAKHFLNFMDTHNAHFVLLTGFKLQRTLSEADWKIFQDRLYDAKKKRKLWVYSDHAVTVRSDSYLDEVTVETNTTTLSTF